MLAGGADEAMMAAVAADGNARTAEAAVAVSGEEGGDGGGDVRQRALDIGCGFVRLKNRSLSGK